MRKDVTRSLLLWPSIASAIVAGLWLLISTNAPVWQLACRQAQLAWDRAGADDLIGPLLAFQLAFDEPMLTESPEVAVVPQLLHAEVPPPTPEIQIVERIEQGESAMKIPDRLVVTETDVLFAPRIDEVRETAGLLLNPASELLDEVAEFSIDFFAADHRSTDQDVSVGHDNADQATQLDLSSRSTSDAPMIVLLEVIDIDNDIARSAVSATPDKSALPSSIANLGDLAARNTAVPDASSFPISPSESAQLTKPARKEYDSNPTSWPQTPRLNEELEILSSLAIRDSHSTPNSHLVSIASRAFAASQWADEVADRLAQLQAVDQLRDPQAGVLIDELDRLAVEGFAQAEEHHHRQEQIQWLRTAYAVARRVAVWQPVFQVASVTTDNPGQLNQYRSADSIPQRIERVRDELAETGDAAGWNRFLLLDEIIEVDSFDCTDQRSVIAKRFLSRLDWHGLDPAHQDWLDRDSIKLLSDALRPWTSEPVDYVALLSQLERKETATTALTEKEIVDALQTLRFRGHSDANAVAGALNTHYRNANVRIAVSKDILQRILPKVQPRTMPVRTQVLGSKVRGVSRVDSDVDVQLQPSVDRWSLTLNTVGNIRTKSVGKNGPAALNTSRYSQFAAQTPIEVTKRDVLIGSSKIDVSSHTRLRGIRTNYDGWPLLGQLMQSVVHSRYRESAGLSNRIANRRTKAQLAASIEQGLDEAFDARSKKLQQCVLGPLGSLRLDPMVVDLRTTDERLLARYRVAGDWQLAAFTPRPRAPRSSLMSLQIHESAINNTLEQLVPRDTPKSIDRMIADAAIVFGRTDAELPSELPTDVEVQFAKTRPITVDIHDGVFSVTLRIIRLNRKDRMRLSQFIVKANYRPEIDGIHAYLVRDGHLRISGPRMSMRERLPVRAIFNKVLSPSRKLQLTLPALVNHPNTQDLAVSQLELRDGWIGMAISQQDAPRIAIRPKAE